MNKVFIAIMIFAALICGAVKVVYAAKNCQWNWQRSHGMNNCSFAAFPEGGTYANVVTKTLGHKRVQVTAEDGANVRLRLICKTSESGVEGAYFGPNNPTVVGEKTCGDSTPPKGYELPPGREWKMKIDEPSNIVLSWISPSGDSIERLEVRLQPVAKVATQAELGAVAEVAINATDTANQALDKANEAHNLAESAQRDASEAKGRSQEAWNKASSDRNVAIDVSYVLGLDSWKQGSKRRGVNLEVKGGVLGDEIKMTTGVITQIDFRQKPIVTAPNQKMSAVDWKTVLVSPIVGISWAANPWFQLEARGGLGLLISVDETVPVSQLPDKELYVGESNTDTGLGYTLGVSPVFVIGDVLRLHVSIGLSGNLTKLPLARGPEKVCNERTKKCLVLRKGVFTDFPLGFGLGVQF